MKLRYYLRGLGIGIVVTAIIMSFTKKPEELTDAEIKIRAAQLGMMEESVLADIEKDNNLENLQSPKEEIENVEEITAEPEQGTEETTAEPEQDTEESTTEPEQDTEETTAEPEQDIEETTTESETEEAEETTTENIPENEQVENYIVISVNAGNGSEVVSQRLFEAGLVNSAVEYNRYLVKNGYDRKLKVGSHEIPVGATEEEMAKILCGRK